jgi:hypothetical protein
VGDRHGTHRPDRVRKERVRPVEGVDVAEAVEGIRPARRLNGPGHLQRQSIELRLPPVLLDAPLSHHPEKVAVGADVIEAVVVYADVGEVVCHVVHRRTPSVGEHLILAGRLVQVEGVSELKALGPLGPPPGRVAPLFGVHGRTPFGGPRTAQEVRRSQAGFPDGWKLPGDVSQRWRGGNCDHAGLLVSIDFRGGVCSVRRRSRRRLPGKRRSHPRGRLGRRGRCPRDDPSAAAGRGRRRSDGRTFPSHRWSCRFP